MTYFVNAYLVTLNVCDVGKLGSIRTVTLVHCSWAVLACLNKNLYWNTSLMQGCEEAYVYCTCLSHISYSCSFCFSFFNREACHSSSSVCVSEGQSTEGLFTVILQWTIHKSNLKPMWFPFFIVAWLIF